ncbi:hypothetical protein L208DRAFT_1321469, partial [Tricholoma matsutake]
NRSTVPPKVTPEDKAPFTQYYLSEAQLQNSVTSSLNDNSGKIQDAKAKVAELLSSLENGMIAANIRCIQECHLLLIFRTVACLGLANWAPNVLSSDPESMYNLLHEHIALKTFEQVSIVYGYSHMGANLSCVHDFALMRKLYQSFVFSYMYGLANSEAKSPGSVVKGKQMTSVWKQHNTLASGRVEVFKAQCFNDQVLALANENKAHSDDELAEGGTDSVYHIKEKEG